MLNNKHIKTFIYICHNKINISYILGSISHFIPPAAFNTIGSERQTKKSTTKRGELILQFTVAKLTYVLLQLKDIRLNYFAVFQHTF